MRRIFVALLVLASLVAVGGTACGYGGGDGGKPSPSSGLGY